jgi:hypothetical protein
MQEPAPVALITFELYKMLNPRSQETAINHMPTKNSTIHTKELTVSLQDHNKPKCCRSSFNKLNLYSPFWTKLA